jgi:hypothetical protein
MVTEEDIRIRSYLLWQAAGRPDGQDQQFWLRAEADLRAEARNAPKQSMRLAGTVVPRVSVCSPPQRIMATRVPQRERRPIANAAMQ